MNLATQCEFAHIYNALRNNKHTMQTISQIVELARYNSRYISDEAKLKLLEIPLQVLKNQAELRELESTWTEGRGSYFAGNANGDDFKKLFAEKNFDLSTMVEYLEYIMNDPDALHSDFKLRNVEVTLRDDVVKIYSSFDECGIIFARAMEEAFQL